MNNAFFGETKEKQYNRQGVELVIDVERYVKGVGIFKFKYAVGFDDDLVTAHKTR